MPDGANGPSSAEMGLTEKDLGIDKQVDKPKRPGGPLKARKAPTDQLSPEKNEEVKLSAYRVLFEGVYDQMRQGAIRIGRKTPEQKGQRFVEEIAQRAQSHIGEIQSQNLTNQAIYQEIWDKMSAYIMRYNGTPKFEDMKRDVSAVYSRLTRHVNALVKSGEVDPLTAKVFVRYLDRYKHIGGHHYNDIVRYNQELPDEILQKEAPKYANILGRLITDYDDDVEEQESGGAIHFNSRKQIGEVTTRIYVTPDLAKSPTQVLNAWYDSLVQTGLKDKIYFKVPIGLSKRQEGIVVYLTDQTNPADVDRLLKTFSASCPPDLLSAVPMPSAVSIARGIAMAPELRNIKTFMRYSGIEEGMSYNQWVASSTEIALELAYHEVVAGGATNITPRMLKEPAEKYFEKIVKLSGVNPDTMVPNALGGKMPIWAEKLTA